MCRFGFLRMCRENYPSCNGSGKARRPGLSGSNPFSYTCDENLGTVKNNKLLETIRILDVLERKRFRNVIKNKKRKTQSALYELCLTRIEKGLSLPEKEEVYAYLFEEPYTKKNDFLLRNEYRLLTDEAEAFLRTVAVEAQYPGLCEAARLRRILESGHTELFKKEFDAMTAKWGNDLWFRVGADPSFLTYFVVSDPFTTEHFERVKSHTYEALDRLHRFYNRLLTDYEVRKAYAEKVYSILSEEPVPPFVSGTVSTAVPDDLVEYRKLKAEAYYRTGEEKIQTLLDAQKILEQSPSGELGNDEVWWLQATIGLEYHLRYDFRNAVLHFDALFQSPGIESFNRLTETGLNYLSALMSCGEFEKAVRVVAPFEERMMASRVVFYKYICLKSISLSYLGDAPAARRELNRVEDHVAEFDFLYWRMAMILSFAVENRWDDAQNEFKNLLKTKNVKQNTRSDLENLIYVTDGLLKIGMARESGKKIPAVLWQQCNQKLEEMTRNPGDFLHPPKLIHKLLMQMKPV